MRITPRGKFFFSKKELRLKKHNSAMNNLLGNDKIAKVLDKSSERKEFLETMQDQAKRGSGGLSKNDMRVVLGKFRSGQGRTINKKEAMALAREVFSGGGKRYIYERKNNVLEQRKNNFRSQQQPSATLGIGPRSRPGSRPNIGPRVGNNVQSRMMPRRTPSAPPISSSSPSLSMRLHH